MTKYKKYMTTYVECFKCGDSGDDNIITFKNIIEGVDVTLCKSCFDKYVINNEVTPELVEMAHETCRLREQYLRENLNAQDLVFDITIKDIKEVEGFFKRIDKTIILDWKDIDDEMHHEKLCNESSMKVRLPVIKRNYNCSNYCYCFNIHFDHNNMIANQIYGYIKALIENIFIISKVSAVDLKDK